MTDDEKVEVFSIAMAQMAVHEQGHAFGLKHVTDSENIMCGEFDPFEELNRQSISPFTEDQREYLNTIFGEP